IKEFKSATADSAAGEGQKDMLMQASAKGEMPSEQQMTLGKETAVISDKAAGETMTQIPDRSDYPRGTIGNAMEQSEIVKLSASLKEDPEFAAKYPSLFDESGELSMEADIKNVLLAIKDHTSSDKSGLKLADLLKEGQLKELLNAAFSEKYTLEPKDIKEKGKIDELYKKIETDMQRIAQNAKEYPSIAQNIQTAASSIDDNIDFIHQVNQMYTYIQIPLKLSGQNATGDLYVYKNKKQNKGDSDELSAFLHFDMEHLGSTDIAVKMKGKAVDTQFFMEDDASYELIANNIGILEKKLTDLGYNCNISVENSGHKVDFVEDFLKQDSPARGSAGMQRYSFDVRA
nr:flagellar hook-length control protein FliK [Lachnospiraceae bacterium]